MGEQRGRVLLWTWRLLFAVWVTRTLRGPHVVMPAYGTWPHNNKKGTPTR